MPTNDKPDFEALRARRNAAVNAHFEAIARELGCDDPSELKHNFDGNACYCDCPNGPCEHDWNGPEWTSQDGCASSVTCSRCGTTAMSHDMRVLP